MASSAPQSIPRMSRRRSYPRLGGVGITTPDERMRERASGVPAQAILDRVADARATPDANLLKLSL